MLNELKFKQGEEFIEGLEALQQEYFVLKPDRRAKINKRRAANRKKKKIMEPKMMVNVLDESLEVDLDELARRDQE
jgi:hypothetical protein